MSVYEMHNSKNMAAWLGDSGSFDISTQNTFRPYTSEEFSIVISTNSKSEDFEEDFNDFKVDNYGEPTLESGVTSESEIIPKDTISDNFIGFSS